MVPRDPTEGRGWNPRCCSSLWSSLSTMRFLVLMSASRCCPSADDPGRDDEFCLRVGLVLPVATVICGAFCCSCVEVVVLLFSSSRLDSFEWTFSSSAVSVSFCCFSCSFLFKRARVVPNTRCTRACSRMYVSLPSLASIAA